MKYTAIISFKVEIESKTLEQATHIANQALPNHFLYRDGKGGHGSFLRALAPVVYEADADYKDIKITKWNDHG